jgi:hypothetical protein
MKEYVRFLLRAAPFTIGLTLSLVGLCYLVRFYDFGFDFESENIWMFVIFFGFGIPTLIYGINRLSNKSQ